MENTMQIINLTPHNIYEVTTGQTFKPSGIVARLDTTLDQVGTVNNIPLYDKLYGTIKNLPDPQPNTYYIVSGIMLDAGVAQGRTDLLAPGELVRNTKGQLIGCKGFSV